MLKPTAQERRTLGVFFQCAVPQMGLYDRATKELRAGVEVEGIFQKNLELLRQLISKRKLSFSRIDQLCRHCLREKRQILWINEVLPEVDTDYESLDRNLLAAGEVSMHRLLTKMILPVSHLNFGDKASAADGEVVVVKRERFAMGELISFFVETFSLTRSKQLDKTLVGAFNYLLAQYELDAVLFAVDFASSAGKSVVTPLALQDSFLPHAQEHVDRRKARR